MFYRITAIDPVTDKRWDDFVQQHPIGSVYHHSSWLKLVASSFLYRSNCYALIDQESDALIGILPLMAPYGLFHRDVMVSLPYATYCDLLIPKNLIRETLEYVIRENEASHQIELRLRDVSADHEEAFVRSDLFVNHSIDLSVGIDSVFSNFHGSCVKRKILKSSKFDLSFHFADGEDDIKRIYDLILLMRKKKGLPPHPYRFFANMWKIYSDLGAYYAPCITYKGKIVSAAIILKYKDVMYYEYAASDPSYQHMGSNQLLLWETIKFGIEKGMKRFDLGRSHPDNHSLIQFKSRWGGEASSLAYCRYPDCHQVRIKSDAMLAAGAFLNKRLPRPVLRLEGEVIYRFLR